MECERDVEKECNLEPGDYLIYIEVDWSQDLVRDFVVSVYGEDAVSLQEFKLNERQIDLLVDDLIDAHHSKKIFFLYIYLFFTI